MIREVESCERVAFNFDSTLTILLIELYFASPPVGQLPRIRRDWIWKVEAGGAFSIQVERAWQLSASECPPIGREMILLIRYVSFCYDAPA